MSHQLTLTDVEDREVEVAIWSRLGEYNSGKAGPSNARALVVIIR